MLTEENLRLLNAEMRNYEMHKRDKFTDIIERQVTDFLDSLDKKVRVQLSKTQLIKSLQKAYKWKKEVRALKKGSSGKAVPREFLDYDLDPGTYKEKLYKQTVARFGGDLSALASSSASNTTSSTASGFGAPEKTEAVLDGDYFEKNVLPHVPSREKNTSISAKRPIAMKVCCCYVSSCYLLGGRRVVLISPSLFRPNRRTGWQGVPCIKRNETESRNGSVR
jgi:hypothetical protein